MAFTLKDIRTGQTHTFSLKEVLKYLGDPVNDEIMIGEDAYRISSFQELGGGEGGSVSIDWVILGLTVESNGEASFYFPGVIQDSESVFLTVNNVLYQYGIGQDYHIQDDRLYWHGPFALETTDQMVLKYPTTIL